MYTVPYYDIYSIYPTPLYVHTELYISLNYVSWPIMNCFALTLLTYIGFHFLYFINTSIYRLFGGLVAERLGATLTYDLLIAGMLVCW